MALVIVERTLAAPGDPHALCKLELAEGCLAAHDVTPLRTLFARDRLHAVCLYRAPDAEAVRATQRAAALPFTHVWTAQGADPDALPDVQLPADRTVVAVQRAFTEPLTPQAMDELTAGTGPCHEMYRITSIASYLSRDGSRLCCSFIAPDAESVRAAQRQNGLPFERAWAADVFDA